jgi:hypothetical protein
LRPPGGCGSNSTSRDSRAVFALSRAQKMIQSTKGRRASCSNTPGRKITGKRPEKTPEQARTSERRTMQVLFARPRGTGQRRHGPRPRARHYALSPGTSSLTTRYYPLPSIWPHRRGTRARHYADVNRGTDRLGSEHGGGRPQAPGADAGVAAVEDVVAIAGSGGACGAWHGGDSWHAPGERGGRQGKIELTTDTISSPNRCLLSAESRPGLTGGAIQPSIPPAKRPEGATFFGSRIHRPA